MTARLRPLSLLYMMSMRWRTVSLVCSRRGDLSFFESIKHITSICELARLKSSRVAQWSSISESMQMAEIQYFHWSPSQALVSAVWQDVRAWNVFAIFFLIFSSCLKVWWKISWCRALLSAGGLEPAWSRLAARRASFLPSHGYAMTPSSQCQLQWTLIIIKVCFFGCMQMN